jgi:ribosomal protein L4
MGDLYRFASIGAPASASAHGGKVAAAAADVKERLDIAAKMREAALKSSIFVGVPRVSLFLIKFPSVLNLF